MARERLVLRKVTNFTKDKSLVYEPYIDNLDADRKAILKIAEIYLKKISKNKTEMVLSSIYLRMRLLLT